MADSRRQKIVDAVVARMKLINGSGSYETDIDDRCEDSRVHWDQETELPAISVFDGEAEAHPTSEANARSTVHSMSVLIRGYVKQGTSAAAARKLIKDIMTAIRQDDKWKVSGTPLVMQTRQGRDAIVRTPESFEVEGCEVEVEVQFLTAKFNAE